MSKKRWYAVTDSDWGWDTTDDGDGAPYIGWHSSPQDAAEAAIKHFEERDGLIDAAHLSVAIVSTIGFASFYKDTNYNNIWDEFQMVYGENG